MRYAQILSVALGAIVASTSIAKADDCGRWVACSSDTGKASSIEYGSYIYGTTSDVEPWMGDGKQASKFRQINPPSNGQKSGLMAYPGAVPQQAAAAPQSAGGMTRADIEATRAYLDGLEASMDVN